MRGKDHHSLSKHSYTIKRTDERRATFAGGGAALVVSSELRRLVARLRVAGSFLLGLRGCGFFLRPAAAVAVAVVATVALSSSCFLAAAGSGAVEIRALASDRTLGTAACSCAARRGDWCGLMSSFRTSRYSSVRHKYE